MIEVERLEKSYGFAPALRGITFAVAKGEVLGFLGPNGAGKSTTMKILTGFLLPTGGRASVAGFDVVNASLEVRRRVGYLPESTPLYTEMRVDDYLAFCAEIRGVPAKERSRKVARAVQLCGLERVTGKDIHELSKGYRQRVGLAQAIVHEPPVLILDEPTSGLDPNQIVEVRKLIERLGEEHTVVLSTHYLQEVEKSCSRVIVVHHGEIVADGTHADLVQQADATAVRVKARGDETKLLACLGAAVPGAAVEVVRRSAGTAEVLVRVATRAPDLGERLAAAVVAAGLPLAGVATEQRSLEDVFRDLTRPRQAAEVGHA
jgi:ABC-2 type transport system ATP-binding protein